MLIILQSNVVTVLRRGRQIICSRFPQDVACKVLLKSVDVSQSYLQNKTETFFGNSVYQYS